MQEIILSKIESIEKCLIRIQTQIENPDFDIQL